MNIERPTSNVDGFVKSLKPSFGVIPAKAGIQQVGWVEERNPTKDRLTQPTNERWPMLEPSPDFSTRNVEL